MSRASAAGLKEPLVNLPFASTVAAAATGLALGSSYHGPPHWGRVAMNGIRIGYAERADLRVVLAFALIHDAFREDDGEDPEHGERAAKFVNDHQATGIFALRGRELDALVTALARHNEGETTTDATIGTCWDADRLDLPRVGITPSPEFFSTSTGRRMVEQAFPRRKESR